VHELSAYGEIRNFKIDKDKKSLRISGKLWRDPGFKGGASYNARVVALFIKPVIVLTEEEKKQLPEEAVEVFKGNQVERFSASLSGMATDAEKLHAKIGGKGLPGRQSVVVDSTKSGWHADTPLAPNRSYVVVPSEIDRYTMNKNVNRGQKQDAFWGSDATFNGEELGVPHGELRVGGLVALIQRADGKGGSTPEVVVFRPGMKFYPFTIGPHGGSIHFLIADRKGTFADNEGTIGVELWLAR
jgi:hypothetical protein